MICCGRKRETPKVKKTFESSGFNFIVNDEYQMSEPVGDDINDKRNTPSDLKRFNPRILSYNTGLKTTPSPSRLVQEIKGINLAKTPFKKYQKCVWKHNQGKSQFLSHKDNYTLILTPCEKIEKHSQIQSTFVKQNKIKLYLD